MRVCKSFLIIVPANVQNFPRFANAISRER
jgi:hypothetical protein